MESSDELTHLVEAAEFGQAPHKLIFLDIDGVLNGRGQFHIVTELEALLVPLVRGLGCDIVLSSMWRLTRESRRQVRAALLATGLPRPISYTPRMNAGHARAAEILAWLQLNTVNQMQHHSLDLPAFELTEEFGKRQCRLDEPIYCSHFAVLDDLDLTAPGRGDPQGLLLNHFVRTPARYGITQHNVDQAHDVLTREKPTAILAAPQCEQCGLAGPQHCEQQWNKFFCSLQCAKRFLQ